MTKIATMRVDKLLSSMGYGSRNDVAALAKLGQIILDGTPIKDVGKRIQISQDLTERLLVLAEPLDPLMGMVILLNKPLGMTCSHKDVGPLVYDLFPDRWLRRTPALSTIGRLDKETTGLLLITDDGTLLHRVISPKRHIRKTYRAKLARPMTGDEAALFASGTLMLNGETKPLAPAELIGVSDTEALLTITEGRYHQVRRMFAATGNHVVELHRTALGGLVIDDTMDLGDWTLLNEAQIEQIFSV